MTVGMGCKSLEVQTPGNRQFSYPVGAFLQVILFFRLDKRDVCCRPTAYSRHPPAHARTASASVFRPPRRVGAGKDVFGLGPILQLAGEAGCGGDGGISGRGAPLPIGVIRHLLD